MQSVFRVERHGATALWIVDRPGARNAIDEGVAEGLERALAEAENDGALRCVVLTGAGGQAFIAGADLKFLRDASPERRSALDLRMLGLLDRMAALPLPVIAALNGVVLGGGAEVALACDMRIAEPHASLTFKHAAMGVTPGWGGLARLCALVSRGTAAKLLFTALPMSADECLRAGLVDEVVQPGQARERALELARGVAQTSPAACADLKALLRAAYERDASTLRDTERSTFLARAQAADHGEALRAFFEKRTPSFAPR